MPWQLGAQAAILHVRRDSCLPRYDKGSLLGLRGSEQDNHSEALMMMMMMVMIWIHSSLIKKVVGEYETAKAL